MEIASGLIKLVKDCEQEIDNWQSVMASRIDEVMHSLRAEGVQIESWFKVQIDGEDYLLWYMRAESIEKAVEVFQKSTNDIDKFHYQALSAVSASDGFINSEPLLSFHNDEIEG